MSTREKNIRTFVEDWMNKGDENSDTQRFWIGLLSRVLNVGTPDQFINFEKAVFVDNTRKSIDGYIPSTSVLIEQKSLGIDLDKRERQSDGEWLTPFQQAKRYNDYLPYDERARWIVVSDFNEFRIYDMNQRRISNTYEKVNLSDLPTEAHRLSFMVDTENVHIKKEMEVSIKAGDIIGVIYDKLLEQYNKAPKLDPIARDKSLNMLCVRLVFCFYAEDAGIFGNKLIFTNYINRYDSKDIRKAIIELFKVLDQKPEERDPFLEEELAAFPYVNGGLFSEEDQMVPQFTDELKKLIVNNAGENFDWSTISPTIFGALFESTLNPETRRNGGMHFTSIENIHKVIDPLFLDDLKAEFESISEIKVQKTKIQKVKEFKKKLGSLTFLDPACGSGNFLTETYLSLRRLENKCIRIELGDQNVLAFSDDEYINVSIQQFYGIEINDFATVVAKTALWIAESQMMEETSQILSKNLEFLPLHSYANIVEGNALNIDWNEVVPKEQTSYIIGNPPFIGARIMDKEQKADLFSLFGKSGGTGNLDYVACWYLKAAQYIQDTNIECALVSTNSITQGEQVAILWKLLINEYGIKINYAWRTFRWDSESTDMAAVHCVIIGFSCSNVQTKWILDPKTGDAKKCNHINPYLLDDKDFFIDKRKNPLCEVPPLVFGNMANDKGNLILSEEEKNILVTKYPKSEKLIRVFYGAEEFLHGKTRYCFWLKGVSPSIYHDIPYIMNRIERVKEIRAASQRTETKKLADTPMLFGEIRQPETGRYIMIPRVSSERREYIPMGFLDHTIIASDATQIIPGASLYHFGVLESSVHMAWMRTVAGRLKSDYRYSSRTVYNNYPWPLPSEEQKSEIEKTAQGILDARALFPDCSLANLYDPITMPLELRAAHKANDKAVMNAYGISDMNESEIVSFLFLKYQELISKKG